MDLQKELQMTNADFTDFTGSVATILKEKFLKKVIRHELTLEEAIEASLAHLNKVNDTIMRQGLRTHSQVADVLCDTVYQEFHK